MDFNLTEQQLMMQKLFREVAQNEVKENAADVDENERFPKESVEVMRQAKMLGIPYSREYGGAGADYLCHILAIEELSKTCATSGVVLSAHTSLGTWPIAQFGTEEQKQRFLTDLCTGKKLAAFGLTEPNAGTDAAGTGERRHRLPAPVRHQMPSAGKPRQPAECLRHPDPRPAGRADHLL